MIAHSYYVSKNSSLTQNQSTQWSPTHRPLILCLQKFIFDLKPEYPMVAHSYYFCKIHFLLKTRVPDGHPLIAHSYYFSKNSSLTQNQSTRWSPTHRPLILFLQKFIFDLKPEYPMVAHSSPTHTISAKFIFDSKPEYPMVAHSYYFSKIYF